tara:strand:+ start:745 stop:960 length:216 start_codon:yes stop_codon:yes gene_type:complete
VFKFFIFLLFFVVSCSEKSNRWPVGMTPFFAECEGEEGVFVDEAYGRRKEQPCRGGWKFFDRGEPNLAEDY